MPISSRTPEGRPNHCPVCGAEVTIEPSDPFADAPCPCCGHLLWFREALPTGRLGARDQLDPSGQATSSLEDRWRSGIAPSPERLWAACDPRGSPAVLADLVKADLRCRYARGQRPAIADYLARLPALRTAGELVVGLLYEEYCLREERGERLDPEQFCARYPDWCDSLASQLRYHRLLSQTSVFPRPRLPKPGTWFGPYWLHSVLGQNGDARVYLAHDEEVGGRPVMLEVAPLPDEAPSLATRLDHSHIVPILSAMRDPVAGLWVKVMPYRPGLPLDQVIARLHEGARPRRARALWEAMAPALMDAVRNSPSDPGWEGFPRRGTFAQGAAWVGVAMARALEHAHARGILHLGIRPANVLMTLRDGPQLMGFDPARAPRPAEPNDAAMRRGCLSCMAPEQLEALLDPARWCGIGPAADLYALGLVLRELLTGRRPDPPDLALPPPRAIRELLDRCASILPPPQSPDTAIPRGLDAIVMRCLVYRPSDRYPSARALADDLRRWLESSTARRLITAAGVALGLRDAPGGAPAKCSMWNEDASASGVWDRDLDGHPKGVRTV